MPLGFRQFPVDWWPSTRLYSLDYANQEMAKGEPEDAAAHQAEAEHRAGWRATSSTRC